MKSMIQSIALGFLPIALAAGDKPPDYNLTRALEHIYAHAGRAPVAAADLDRSILSLDSGGITGLHELVTLAALSTDPEQSHHWLAATHRLGLLASVGAPGVNFRKLASVIEQIEAPDVHEGVKRSHLAAGYRAIGRFGTPEARDFLLARIEAAFWGDREARSIFPNGDYWSPRHDAIVSLSILGREEDIRLVESLQNQMSGRADRSTQTAFEIALKSKEDRVAHHAGHRQMYREIIGAATAAPMTTIEQNAPRSRAKGPIDRPTVQRAVVADKSADKQSTTMSGDETVASTWQWWLVGGAAVLLAVGLALRRTP